MDLFKLLGTISIKNAEANSALDDTSKKGKDTGDALTSSFSKIGSAIVDGFKREPIDRTKRSLVDLTGTVDKQETELKSLKAKYVELYSTHGKNSTEARNCAKEIKQLSAELQKNKSRLNEAESAADKFDKSLKDTGDSANKTEGKLSRFFSAAGKGAVTVGSAIAKGLAVGAAAMGALTIKALQLTGNLEQNMGGSEQVFKEYAGQMQKTAKEAFSNMGLSTNDFLATANKMGALFQGAGFDIKESADMSSKAMQRAADVASIMGIDTESAMEAIAGAAKGNFTMMDNLGVAMNDTTLQAYALEKGIKKSTTEMTNQEKVGLAMEMFMEKTAYAAGNYARENETLAGSLGTAKAALTNFLDGSGDVDSLVNAFSNAADVIVKNLQTVAPRLISGLTEIINRLVPMIPPLLQSLLPVVVDGAVSLINGLVAAMPMILTALLDAVPALIQGFHTIFDALIQALPQLMQLLVSALPELYPLIYNSLYGMVITLVTMLPQLIQPLIDYLPEIITAVVSAFLTNLPALIGAGAQLLLGLLEGMLSLIGKIPEILAGIFSAIVDGIKALFGIHSPSTVMAEIGKFIMQGLINGIKSLISGIQTIWNNVKTIVTNVFNSIKTTVSNIFTSIKTTATTIWNGVLTAIKTPIEKAKTLVKDVVEAIKGFFDFEIKWPNIPTPKFGIKPKGWKIGDLLDGTIPKLNIEWHAKAMNKPMIMNDPTIFGYNPATGSLMGGGEVGSEVVSGTSTLMNMIQSAVQTENTAMLQRMERIIDILTMFFPEMLSALDIKMYLDGDVLVAETAGAMDTALGKIAVKKGRGR